MVSSLFSAVISRTKITFTSQCPHRICCASIICSWSKGEVNSSGSSETRCIHERDKVRVSHDGRNDPTQCLGRSSAVKVFSPHCSGCLSHQMGPRMITASGITSASSYICRNLAGDAFGSLALPLNHVGRARRPASNHPSRPFLGGVNGRRVHFCYLFKLSILQCNPNQSRLANKLHPRYPDAAPSTAAATNKLIKIALDCGWFI